MTCLIKCRPGEGCELIQGTPVSLTHVNCFEAEVVIINNFPENVRATVQDSPSMNPSMSVEHTRELLRTWFPGLAIDTIVKLGEGWDSTAFLVAESIVVRIPKIPPVSRQMVKEIRVLETIEPYVSVQIPKIEWSGTADEEFPVSAMAYRKLGGASLSGIHAEDRYKSTLKQVAQFLTDLHGIPLADLNKAAIPWFRWTGDESLTGPADWVAGLRGFVEQIIQNIVPVLPSSTGERVTQTIFEFLSCPEHFQFEPVLLHGDLSPEHILVCPKTGEIGVIDFGDCGLGDPAYDVWPGLVPWYRPAVTDTFQARQRFYRQLAPFHGVLFGQMQGNRALVNEGLKQITKEFTG